MNFTAKSQSRIFFNAKWHFHSSWAVTDISPWAFLKLFPHKYPTPPQMELKVTFFKLKITAIKSRFSNWGWKLCYPNVYISYKIMFADKRPKVLPNSSLSFHKFNIYSEKAYVVEVISIFSVTVFITLEIGQRWNILCCQNIFSDHPVIL